MNRSRIEALALALALAGVPVAAQTPNHKKAVVERGGDSVAKARAQIAKDDLAGAETTLFAVLTAHPENAEALTTLGIVRGRQQRFAEAEALFRRSLQIDPRSAVARRNLANALAAQDKFDDAVKQYQDLEKADPKDPALKIELAQLYLAKGKFENALAELNAIPELPAEAVPLKAAGLIGMGRQDEAEGLIASATKSPAAAIDLAEVFVQANLPGDAVKALDNVPVSRRTARFFYLKGKAEQLQGAADAAVTDLKRALALDPKATPTLLALAEAYANKKQHAEAVSMLQQAHAADGESLPVLRHLLGEAMAAGNRNVARNAARELWQKSPDNADDVLLAAAAMLQEKDTDNMVDAFRKYVALRPDDAKGWLGLGMSYSLLNRYSEASEALEHALKEDSQLAEAEYQKGAVALHQAKPEEAMQHFQRAVELQPSHSKALTALGKLYLEHGDLQKARDVLEKSEGIDPNNFETEYELGLTLSKLGQVAEAKQRLERYEKLKPGQVGKGR